MASTIIELFSSLATIAAVVVALYANHTASKDLKAALKMHEQLKGVELLTERVNLLQRCKKAERRFEFDWFDDEELELYINVLFPYEVKKYYYNARSSKHSYDTAKKEEQIFFSHFEKEEGNTVKDTIQTYLSKLSDRKCPHTVKDEFSAFCKEHIISVDYVGTPSWIEVSLVELMSSHYRENRHKPRKTEFNYEIIHNSIERHQNDSWKNRRIFFEEMEKYIKDSVSPLKM